MRFSEISIKNYRQYQRMDIKFPLSGDRDLQVLIARNGVGKTTLLNSINWCLYEDEPHLGDSSSALPVVNIDAIKRAAQQGNHTESASVEIVAESDDERLIINREHVFSVGSDGTSYPRSQKFTVTVCPSSGGDPKVYQNAEANKIIQKHLPSRIREFFFFDGEQLDSYFKSDPGSRIRNTIHAISQVDLITKVIKHLDEMITIKEREAGKRLPNVDALNKRLDEKKANVLAYTNEIEDRTASCHKNEERINELNRYLSEYEDAPELNQQWQKLEAEKSDVEAQIAEGQSELMRFVRDAKVDFAFYPAAVSTLQYIEKKRNARQLPANIDTSVLISATQTGTCGVCGQELSEDALQRITKMLEEFKVSNETSSILIGIESELNRLVANVKNYPSNRDKKLQRVKRLRKKLKEIVNEMAHVDEKIQGIGDQRLIAKYHEERKKLKAENDAINQRIGGLKSARLKASKLAEEAQNKIDKALSKESKCKAIREEIAFLKKARKLAFEIEQEAMAEVRETMEKATSNYFKSFVWKENTFDRVILDDNYQVDLIHREGYSCLGSCSAGERALLALAFTLAIHKVSGFNAPLFIDTPLARISDENRTNFAEVLSEVGRNKEIIMTFTPSEYSEEILEVFDPILTTKRELSMIDERTTTVKEII